MEEEVKLCIIGRVQGVGFRAIVKQHASDHGIRGYVKNLPNGEVEVRAQGSKKELEAFVKTLREKPGVAQIERFEMKWGKPERHFPSFEIHYFREEEPNTKIKTQC